MAVGGLWFALSTERVGACCHLPLGCFLVGVDLGLMDYFSWFFVESKIFELSVPVGGSFFRLVERRKGLSRVMTVGRYSVVWLKKVMEKMVRLAVDRAFT